MTKQRFWIGICSILVAASVSADHHKPDVTGAWLGVGVGPNGESSESTMTISKKEGKLVATSVNDQGVERDLDRIKFDGKSLVGELDFDQNGQVGVLGIKAKLNAKGELKGNWYANDDSGSELYSGEWSAVRVLSKVIAGRWNVVAETDNGPNEHEIEISKSGRVFTGAVVGDSGSADLESVKVKQNKLSFEFAFGEGTVKVAAVQMGPKKLSGEWTYFDSSDTELGSGSWKATK